MDAGVVEYDDGGFGGIGGQAIQTFDDIGGGDGMGKRVIPQPVVPRKQAKVALALAPLSRDAYVFIFELPAIGHIPLFRNRRFVSVEQVDLPLLRLLFQQGQSS